MKVADLIALLEQQPRSATVYAQTIDQDGMPVLIAVDGIAPANSDAYGSAVVIEMED